MAKKMGEPGLDNWYWTMKEHQKKGHRIIQYQYPDRADKKMQGNVKQKSIPSKEKRAAFWKNHHSIPTVNDLIWWGDRIDEVEI